MDLGTTIIGLLALSLFIVPVFIIARSANRKSNAHRNEFFSQVSKNEMYLSEKDIWNRYALGIDTTKNRVVYVNAGEYEPVTTVFNVSDVKKIETWPATNERNRKGFSYKNIRELRINIQLKENRGSDVIILFYLPEFGTLNESHIKRFQKWTRIFNQCLMSGSAGGLKHSA